MTDREWPHHPRGSERFADRAAAGRALAMRLRERALAGPLVVLALPRGGVPVAAEVARALHAPLDLLLVRKIGAPGQPELAVAAVAEGEAPVRAGPLAGWLLSGADARYVAEQAGRQQLENERRRSLYLGGRAPWPVRGATVLLVDDGVATGTTMLAALRALRKRAPARIVVAVPVASAEALADLAGEADEIVCLAQPSPFEAVGLHYIDFHQVGDDEVIAALAAAPAAPPAAA